MRFLFSLVLVSTPLAAQGGASENTAFHLSLWSTVVPVVAGAVWWMNEKDPTPNDPLSGPERTGPSLVMMGGFVFGPAIGYGAAGMSGRAWKGIGLRSGLTLLSIAPAFAVCGWDCTTGDAEYELAWLILATGTGLSTASAIIDITRVKQNIRRHRAAAPASEPALSIAPTYAPGRSAGVLVHVSF